MDGRIKIAYLIDTIHSDRAGTEKQLLGIIPRLNKNLFEPYLVCLKESSWMKENELPCEVFLLPYQGLLKPSIREVVSRLQKFLREKQIAIVQTFFEDALLVGYLAKPRGEGAPLLFSSRRDLGLGNGEPWYHDLFRIFRPVVNRRFDGLVTNSEKVKEVVMRKERLPAAKVRVIRNGVAIPEPCREIPAIFRENRAEIWIALTANLKPIKRVDVFLNAFQLLFRKRPEMEIRALIMGEGPLRQELQGLCRRLAIADRVHFAGSVSNVADHLRQTDIGVLSSDQEGLSNAILEYMSCGLPVVATDVGGNPELVDRTNGVCVSAGDPEAMAMALSRLAGSRDLRRELGGNSLAKIKSRHSWESVMQDWERYYLSPCHRGLSPLVYPR